MNKIEHPDSTKPERNVQMQGTHILEKELDSLQFSVWDTRRKKGHSEFIGDAIKTAKYLENNDKKNLEVSALDVKFMRSLEPIPARNWLIWYHQTTRKLLKEHNFDDQILVPYPTNY